jgi:hypothetical protein
MTDETPRDTSSYLRLARPARGAWPRLAVGVVCAAVGFLVVSVIALLVVGLVARLFGSHLVIDAKKISALVLLATNLGLALCIPLAGLLAFVFYRLHFSWLVSVQPGLRRRWLLTCLGCTAVVWGVLFLLALLGVAASKNARYDGRALAIIVVVLLTTPFQAAGEEFLFRGFLMQSLGATGLRAPVCWVVSGALFATAHGQFAPPLFADRLLIGIVFGWLATITGGLEASISIHAIKNMSVLIPAALLGNVTGSIEPTNVTWVPVVLDAVMLAIVGAWIRSRVRRTVASPERPQLP